MYIHVQAVGSHSLSKSNDFKIFKNIWNSQDVTSFNKTLKRFLKLDCFSSAVFIWRNLYKLPNQAFKHHQNPNKSLEIAVFT